MKRIILFILLLFAGLSVFGQQTYWTPGVPPGSTSFSPTYRFIGTDSLAKFFLANSNRWSQVYTATQVNSLLGTVLPSQTGNSGKYLTTNGTIASWATVAGGVSSVGSGYGLLGGPIISTGTLTVDTNKIGLANDMILSGMVTTVSGTTATTTAGTYRLNGTVYTISSTNTTIPTADATLSRFSVIYGNTSGALAITNGSLSANPDVPTIPANTLLVSTILITPTGTTTTGGSGKISANNGLTLKNGTIQLGGTLLHSTTVNYAQSIPFSIIDATSGGGLTMNGGSSGTIVLSSNTGATNSTLSLSQSGYSLVANSSGNAVGISSNTTFGNTITDQIFNIGGVFAGNYTTNQRLQRRAIASVNTVIALADSVKGTISGGTTTNPLTFSNAGAGDASGTIFNGALARTISWNSIGAQQALTLTTTGTSGAATLSGGALNIPQYSGATGANPTATAGATAVNGSATTFMRSDAAPKVDSSAFRTVANSYSLSGLQTKFNGYVPTSTTVAGFALSSNVTLANISAGTGLTFSNYNGSSAITAKADTTVLQTVANFFPKGDTRYVRSATIFANPSASIGLTAVNGSATTAMRSDAAPALSQSIVPTWTGLHTFQQNSLATVTTDAIYLQNNTASTSGVPNQYSPSLHFGSQVWNTTATAANNWGDWRVYQNVTSGASPNTTLNFDYSVSPTSTPSYTNQLKIDKFGLSTAGTLTVGAGMTVNGQLNTVGGLNSLSYNIFLPSTLNIGLVSASQLLYGGGSNNFIRTSVGASQTTVTTVSNGNTYSDFIIGSAPIELTASAVVPWASQAVIKSPGTVTLHSGSITNFAGLYLENPGTPATNNYALYVAGGNVNVQSLTASTPLQSDANKNIISAPVGQTTLVSGTKAITVSGLTTSSRAFVTLVSIGGTVTTTWQYAAVCTANTITITALTSSNTTNTSDTSILNYWVVQ